MAGRNACGWMTAVLAAASVGAAAQVPPPDTRVLEAASAADTVGVVTLIQQGVEANAAQADGATALHWAAHYDDTAMAKALLDAGATVDPVNDFGVTPLWLAAVNGSAAMVESLLGAGADANAALPSGETVLMTASRSGSAPAVRLLVAHGALVNTTEQTRGQTALMWAVAQQHPEVVAALVELGADVHMRSDPLPRRIHTRTEGFNPTGVLDVVQGGYTALLFAARQGHLDAATSLLAAGADVNDAAPAGTSALVVAAHGGHTALAIYLLDQGADPNAAEAGYTALHAATLRDDATLAAALLAAGADPTATVVTGSPGRRNSPDYVLEHDVVGANAFWLAAQYSAPGVMQALANHGDPGQVVVSGGTTALMAATRAQRRTEPGLTPNLVENERLVLEAVRVALDVGVDVNAANDAGNTALHTAASRHLDTVVQLLVDRGADVDVWNQEGVTPLMAARGRNDAEDNSTVALLRQLGATE
ncbi:MAG: ankyrin repeat domain-containing protein [Acidobacteria bacterium]|nr:ankyrin repeat domain-containing protein [Acidobacteriota bacterium]